MFMSSFNDPQNYFSIITIGTPDVFLQMLQEVEQVNKSKTRLKENIYFYVFMRWMIKCLIVYIEQYRICFIELKSLTQYKTRKSYWGSTFLPSL